MERTENNILLHKKFYIEAGFSNETPWTEVQGFLVAPRLRRITYASLRAPFIPEFKSSGFSGRFDKIISRILIATFEAVMIVISPKWKAKAFPIYFLCEVAGKEEIE